MHSRMQDFFGFFFKRENKGTREGRSELLVTSFFPVEEFVLWWIKQLALKGQDGELKAFVMSLPFRRFAHC